MLSAAAGKPHGPAQARPASYPEYRPDAEPSEEVPIEEPALDVIEGRKVGLLSFVDEIGAASLMLLDKDGRTVAGLTRTARTALGRGDRLAREARSLPD